MKHAKKLASFALTFIFTFAGCAALPPNGPGIISLPGTGKSLAQFQIDDGNCRSFAIRQSTPGDPNAGRSTQNMQRSYDHAFIQCMYAQGHRVPVPGRILGGAEDRGGLVPPPPPGMPPPPPPVSSP